MGKYQSRATCFDIQTSAYASVRIMSKHVTLDWYFPIWNSRSFLILIVHSGRKCFLPPWTELSRKYLGTDKCIFRGVVQDSIYDVTAWLLAWRCHRQRCHDVVLRTTKTTSKSDYLLKIKAWEKNNQSLHSGRDKGFPCPFRSVVIDSIRLSLPRERQLRFAHLVTA